MRQRGVEAMPIKVPLPQRSADDLAKEPTLVLRIPEQGGLSAPGSGLPRGLLLLTLVPSAEPDPSVKLAQGVSSKVAASLVESDEMAKAILAPARRRPGLALVALILAVALWILLLLWLRLSGRG